MALPAAAVRRDVRRQLAAVRRPLVAGRRRPADVVAVRRRGGRLRDGAAVQHRDAAHDRLRVARDDVRVPARRRRSDGAVGGRRAHPVRHDGRRLRQAVARQEPRGDADV